jgi:hypothetical protein
MMNIKTGKRIKLAFRVVLALFAGAFICTTKSFSAVAPSDLDYFKGKWVVTMKADPKQAFDWTVKEDLQGGWMVGVVERNGEKVSTDFWRQNGNKIERFAFTADGLFVRIEGSAWESDRLVLTGVASNKRGETKIRETITRINDRRFLALWEREGPDGKWTTFADEICTK